MSEEQEDPEVSPDIVLEENRKLITWKDADQNLMTIAISMIDAAKWMRTSETQTITFDTDTPNRKVKPGWISKTAGQGWWTLLHRQSGMRTVVFDEGVSPELSPTCWYSFVNMVRQRLTQARAEMHENLYPQKKKLRTDKTATRNPNGKRRSISQFGRTPERPE